MYKLNNNLDNIMTDRAKMLIVQYKINWGYKLDLTMCPSGLNRNTFIKVLERVVCTGESLGAGYDALIKYGVLKETSQTKGSNIQEKSGLSHYDKMKYSLRYGDMM